jgi:hypothetical protein
MTKDKLKELINNEHNLEIYEFLIKNPLTDGMHIVSKNNNEFNEDLKITHKNNTIKIEFENGFTISLLDHIDTLFNYYKFV